MKKDDSEQKTFWLKKLSKTGNWVDGDIESPKGFKSADLVNHEMKLVIELKHDWVSQENRPYPTREQPTVTHIENLKQVHNRISKYIRDANKKFENYPNYKTILIFQTFRDHSFEYMAGGFLRLNQFGRIPNDGVGFTTSSKNVGLVIAHESYYLESKVWETPRAQKNRIPSDKDIALVLADIDYKFVTV